MSSPDCTIRALRRGEGQVVLGVGSDAPQVIEGLTSREARALVRAGALTARQWARIGLSRPPSARWPEVIATVARAACHVSRPSTRLRTIALSGADASAELLAATLAPLAEQVVTDQVHLDRLEAGLSLGVPHQPPDLVLLLALEALPAHVATTWQHHGVPHLPVVFTADGFAVGPLVASATDPCTTCLDLHRADRDPHWADLLTQLSQPARPAALAPADVTAYAAGVVGSVLRGGLAAGRLPPGVVVTGRIAPPEVQHHQWGRHPRCRRHGNAPASEPRPGH